VVSTTGAVTERAVRQTWRNVRTGCDVGHHTLVTTLTERAITNVVPPVVVAGGNLAIEHIALRDGVNAGYYTHRENGRGKYEEEPMALYHLTSGLDPLHFLSLFAFPDIP
jgi:hypothetical protein